MARVLMLGADASMKGGVASVIKGYRESGMMDRMDIQFLATYRDGSKIGKLLFFLRQFPRVVLQMLSVKIVHLHSSHGWSFRRLVALLQIAHLLGRKTVLHIHGSQFDTYFENASVIEKRLIRHGLRRASVVVALSADWKEKLIQIEPSANIAIVRNAVHVASYRQKMNNPRSSQTILFLGRLGQRKGIYDLLRAIEILMSRNSNFRFVLAGDGDVEKVKSIVRQRGWESCVDVPGWIGPTDKSALLAAADVFVLPSYQEGLPMSILEAMASGLPVVSTPIGGIPEAVIDGVNGYLVTPGDHVALADRIDRLLRDDDLRESFSRSSLSLAIEKFDTPSNETELQSIYASLTA